MGSGHVYECFNEEQGEELPTAWGRIADSPRREHVEADARGSRGENKKEMLHEILGIVEDNVAEGKINEQKYKQLSELLMEFHGSIQ